MRGENGYISLPQLGGKKKKVVADVGRALKAEIFKQKEKVIP